MIKPQISNPKFQILALALLIACGLAAVASACNVPVFRYALERWRQDSFRVTVFHKGPLSEADKALVAELQDKQDRALANLFVDSVDVDQLEDAEASKLFEAFKDMPLPRMVMQYPRNTRYEPPVWSAALSSESVASLVDSPVRKELVRRLSDGQTAVWLVLESGDVEKDKTAVELVEAEIKKLAKELKLPELSDAPADKLQTEGELKIEFSLLRVPRGAAEAPLVEMLVQSESDLAERKDPLVFPVFGRCRALFPLVGAGITADNIHDSAAFLVGACSCEVKELNPGFDLLVSADWDTLLSPTGIPLPAAEARLPADSDVVELVPIPAGSQTVSAAAVNTSTSAPVAAAVEPAQGLSGRVFLIVGGILAACLIALVGLVVAVMPRGQT